MSTESAIVNYEAKRRLQNRFQDHLTQLARQRQARAELVQTPYGLECAWAGFERSKMLDLINDERRRLGKNMINQDDVDREERQACGHVDYLFKFSLYCAELVLQG
ncbi:hypothetical protein M8C13_07340 [Crossiella sp. SN42]|uniref:hypothetical protein n=1 Tax=Crossiella sp. SN42 TaxID=2944808 RepID=UPI00207CC39A|nr:hypothetical protein [Crossiella sp. SN42]MCO1575571.1 hypothetical protein [Crossiella sp. SN42]